MGLLDEAIREHLELKRRRGADPTEIAREEREVLEPIFPDEASASPVEGALDEHVEPPHLQAHEHVAYEHEVHAEQPAAEAPIAGLGEETVEIDMQAVLEADAIAAEQTAGDPRPAGDQGFEWELPDRSAAEPAPEPIPGQERLSFE